MNSVSLKTYVRNVEYGSFRMSLARTRWNRGWYLCIEFRIVCGRRIKNRCKRTGISGIVRRPWLVRFDQPRENKNGRPRNVGAENSLNSRRQRTPSTSTLRKNATLNRVISQIRKVNYFLGDILKSTEENSTFQIEFSNKSYKRL